MRKTCIVIVGPTAVGKTDLAIQVAKKYDTAIISCDSRQCYRELNIGVAKPSAQQLSAIQHFFINSHSIHEEVTAALFEQYALEKAADIFKRRDMVVMVGGTGLYANAFCQGLDEIPAVSAEIRKAVTEGYEKNGIDWLQSQLKQRDALFFKKGEIKNPRRLMRALEVVLATGISILEYQRQVNKKRDFDIIKIGLELPRPLLYQRISERVDEMLRAGLVDEVKSLLPHIHLNALQTVGYREWLGYFQGNKKLEDCLEEVKVATRQYAKRQMTWFKKDPLVQWCSPDWMTIAEFLP